MCARVSPPLLNLTSFSVALWIVVATSRGGPALLVPRALGAAR
jgi:hypothetical protein